MRGKKLRILQGDLEEVRAYRDLQSVSFDFGTGLITNDSNESEDAYYEMQEQFLEDMILDLKEEQKIHNRSRNKPKKKRNNRYALNKRAKQRLRRLEEQGVYFVYETIDEENGKPYIKQFYLSGCRGYAKKETNRKIRNSKSSLSLKGSDYRKVYDYWWTVF